MTTRPMRIAQTSKEAQKAYKKNGPRLPERQQRQLERLAELDTRAARSREQEERRRIAKKKREEKERKEREARRQMGVGLATQMVGYSHTQAKLKSGMEAFLGLKETEDKKRREREEREEREVREKLESIAEDLDKELLDANDGDDANGDLAALDATIELEGDHWIDDDLDDDSMLKAHDLLISDTTVEVLDSPSVPSPLSLPAPIPEVKRLSSGKEDLEFLRLHGPMNKTIEDTLRLLPESLVEMLSQDTSADFSIWNPAPSLLHKLNPAGLPPHRLRLKVGCVVSLLRDLNTSSQLSKSSLLRVLRIENEWLECLVLDGQLEGTKAFLSRIAFPARYRNEDQFAFQRKQFPIRVSTKHGHLSQSRAAVQSTFKIPSMSGQPAKLPGVFRKPLIPAQKAKTNTNMNPIFKLPGVPAGRVTKPLATYKPKVPIMAILDSWDDFLDSGTQIARELSLDDATPIAQSDAAPAAHPSIPLSTQDLDFDMEDLKDASQLESGPPKINSQAVPTKQNTSHIAHPIPHTISPGETLGLTGKLPPVKCSLAPPQPPRSIKPKAPPIPIPSNNHMAPPLRPSLQPIKRRASPALTLAVERPLKRSPTRLPAKPIEAPKAAVSLPSFCEFGLSTQDAVAFFDDDEDDEMAVGSRVIVV